MITPEEFLAAGDHLVLFIIIDHQPFYHLDLINLIVKICRWIQTLSLFYTRFTIVPPGSGPQVNKRVNLDFPNSSKNSHWCPIYSGDEASVKEYLPKEKQFLITRSHNLPQKNMKEPVCSLSPTHPHHDVLKITPSILDCWLAFCKDPKAKSWYEFPLLREALLYWIDEYCKYGMRILPNSKTKVCSHDEKDYKY